MALVLPPTCIDMKHCFFIWAPTILKQRTQRNISFMLSAPASPATMRGRLLKNDFSWGCQRLVLCYLFSQWIIKCEGKLLEWLLDKLIAVHNRQFLCSLIYGKKQNLPQQQKTLKYETNRSNKTHHSLILTKCLLNS